jgi:hypothetical protein
MGAGNACGGCASLLRRAAGRGECAPGEPVAKSALQRPRTAHRQLAGSNRVAQLGPSRLDAAERAVVDGDPRGSRSKPGCWRQTESSEGSRRRASRARVEATCDRSASGTLTPMLVSPSPYSPWSTCNARRPLESGPARRPAGVHAGGRRCCGTQSELSLRSPASLRAADTPSYRPSGRTGWRRMVLISFGGSCSVTAVR